MRPRQLIVIVGLLSLVMTPLAGAQGTGVTSEVEVTTQGEPLADASPVEPGQALSVTASVTVPSDDPREWRAFLNATTQGTSNETAAAWAGGQQALTGALDAPSSGGDYQVVWELTVQSRNTTTDGANWTTEQDRQGSQAYSVRQAPPQASEVTITVGGTAGGAELAGQTNLTAGETIILNASAALPDRADTQWRLFFNASMDGAQVVSEQIQGANRARLSVPAQATAPSEAGDYELAWTVTVEYRDANDANATFEPVAEQTGAIPFGVEPLAPPPGPGLPWGWILGIGAVAVAGGGVAYWWTQRDTQIRGQARSSAMRELEGETFDEPADTEPEVHPQLKILEARAEDVKRMIELAKDRHERGDLTEHQYNTIRERKEDELEEIQAEMDEYR